MDSLALARQIADGDRFQELTRPTKTLAQDRLFRIFRKPGPGCAQGVRDAGSSTKRTHALEALAGIEGVVVRLGGDLNAEVAWSLFADPGEWSLAQLPENSRLGLSAGRILRAVHDSDLVYEAEQRMFDTGSDSFEDTVDQLQRAVERVG